MSSWPHLLCYTSQMCRTACVPSTSTSGGRPCWSPASSRMIHDRAFTMGYLAPGVSSGSGEDACMKIHIKVEFTLAKICRSLRNFGQITSKSTRLWPNYVEVNETLAQIRQSQRNFGPNTSRSLKNSRKRIEVDQKLAVWAWAPQKPRQRTGQCALAPPAPSRSSWSPLRVAWPQR